MPRLYSYGAYWRMLTIFAAGVLTRQLAVAQPVINSVTPMVGPGKMELMITGHGFSPYGGHNIIHYGATQYYTLYSGTDTLRVVVPYSTSYEPIMVNADA